MSFCFFFFLKHNYPIATVNKKPIASFHPYAVLYMKQRQLRASPMASLSPRYRAFVSRSQALASFLPLQRRLQVLPLAWGPPSTRHLARHSGRAAWLARCGPCSATFEVAFIGGFTPLLVELVR